MLGSLVRWSLASFASAWVLCGLAANAHADPAARARAEAIMSAIEARAPDRALTTAVVGRARHALSRATQARNAGDQRHASELEALGLALAETAHDLVRTAEAEKKLSTIEQSALEAETRVVRARALVEQAAARRGRAAEQLRSAEAEKASGPDQGLLPKKGSTGKAATAVPPRLPTPSGLPKAQTPEPVPPTRGAP